VGIGYARGWGQLTVQVVAIDDYGLLLSGEVDMEACEEFREFAELAVDGRREVVLDVVDLAFLDSAGVRRSSDWLGSHARTAWSFICHGRTFSASSTCRRSRSSQVSA
jgi:hypothetical protein